ncbi:MAG: hypothetical protein U0V74_10775 [Chitinophagales bacterium]
MAAALCCVVLGFQLNAQSISATFVSDSTSVEIGEHVPVKFNLRFSGGIQPQLPQWRDTIGELEIVKTGKLDTFDNGKSTVLSQNYILTAFDSGEYHTGVKTVYYKTASGRLDSVLSNDLMLEVSTVAVDTAKPIKQIKAPLQQPYTWDEFLYYYIAGGILLALIIALIFYLRWRNRRPAPEERPKPKEPAHIWARAELKKLEEEKLWQKDETKRYYTRLTEILRLYIEFRYGYYAMESTTAEIEAQIQTYHVKRIAQEKLLAILNQADLVKFAKLLPPPDENIKNMERAYAFVELTEPKEEKEEKKQK